jgi:hypothetical protein
VIVCFVDIGGIVDHFVDIGGIVDHFVDFWWKCGSFC